MQASPPLPWFGHLTNYQIVRPHLSPGLGGSRQLPLGRFPSAPPRCFLGSGLYPGRRRCQRCCGHPLFRQPCVRPPPHLWAVRTHDKPLGSGGSWESRSGTSIPPHGVVNRRPAAHHRRLRPCRVVPTALGCPLRHQIATGGVGVRRAHCHRLPLLCRLRCAACPRRAPSDATQAALSRRPVAQ